MTYVSEEATDAIYLALDNLDRLTLSLVVKVEEYRRRYNKDPRTIMFNGKRKIRNIHVVNMKDNEIFYRV